ncbi:MAG: AAA family ATPase, partial [Actinomycetota bacterium]
MRLCKVYLPGYERSLHLSQEFEVGRFTVLFGKNNAGKTNLLEDIYLMIATRPPSGGEARIRRVGSSSRLPDPTGDKTIGQPVGVLYVELDPEFDFDRSVLDACPIEWEPVHELLLRFRELPSRQVCYATTDHDYTQLWFTDAKEFYEQAAEGFVVVRFGDEGEEDLILDIDEQQRSGNGPFPQPLFLGWEFSDVDKWVTSEISELSAIPGDWDNNFLPRKVWCESPQAEAAGTWQVRDEVYRRLDQLATLATDLLPDFLDGFIRAEFIMPSQWDELPQIEVTYHEWSNSEGRPIEHFGRGASRWMGIAVQTALRLMRTNADISVMGAASSPTAAGHVLFIDEPEAHLHHSAVASVVRWCHRMVACGFNLMVASHHEEFLRASGDDVTFVKVTRESKDAEVFKGLGGLVSDEPPALWTTPSTTVRTIASAATSTLQELADEIGLHPASALSLHRAILFVEGILDEAVLDQYAWPAFGAAGVTIIPIHGTKNLEGLIDGEFAARLGIKTGVLTDNTVIET